MKVLALLLAGLLLAACSGAGPTPTPQAVDVVSNSVAAPDAAAATQLTPAEQGRALFRNKGCVTCHLNRRVEGESRVMDFGAPNLTDYSNDPDFLRRWLTNPSAVRPGTRMPNLHLSADEIESLIAFLNEPR